MTKAQSIQLQYRNSAQEVTTCEVAAQVTNCGMFGLHPKINDKGEVELGSGKATITHIPTGMAVAKITLAKVTNAILLGVMKDLEYSISDITANINISDPVKAGKSLKIKQTVKWLLKRIKCEESYEVERMVGVFYRDRGDAEKLRLKIDPTKNNLRDEAALLDQSTVTSLMMGKMTLP